MDVFEDPDNFNNTKITLESILDVENDGSN